ncbi:MAG: hypothetical protein R2752_00995 [Vicinamibacterales bacterium]
MKLAIATDGTPSRAATAKASGGMSPTMARTRRPASAATSWSTRASNAR